jgi:hypothetical protein
MTNLTSASPVSSASSNRRRWAPYGGALAAAAALLFAVTGCAGTAGADSPGKVATITSPGGAASPKASTAAAGAPRERLDGTAEDYDKLTQPYYHCFKDHGGPVKELPGGMLGKVSITNGNQAQVEKAAKACEQLFPLPPAELDPTLNANFDDERRAFIACMTKNGVKVKISGKTWAYEDGGGNWGQFEQKCMLASFGKKK